MKAHVIDLTRAHPGSERRIFAAILNETPDASETDTYIIGTRMQQGVEESYDQTATFLPVDDSQQGADVVKLLGMLATVKFAEYTDVVVYSFWVPVLVDVNSRKGWKSVHLGSYAKAPENLTEWPQQLMPLDDALAALGVTLATAVDPEHAILKTAIRPMLASVDPRFAKSYSPAANQPGLIGLLVRAAIQRDIVGTIGEDPQQRLWLKRGGGPLPGIAEMAATASSDPRPSHRYVGVLREKELGPFSDVRRQAFEEFDKCLAENPEKSVSALVAQAIGNLRARDLTPIIAWQSKHDGKPYPWRKLGSFLNQLFNCLPVLLDEEGKPFLPRWTGSTRGATGTIPGWHQELDGLLVLALVDSGVEIPTRNLEELAGALFADRSEVAQQMTAEVVQMLEKRGDLTFGPAPQFILTRPQPQEESSPAG